MKETFHEDPAVIDRRTFHVPVTTRVGVAAAVVLGAVGVVAGSYGIVSAGQNGNSLRHTSIGLPDTAVSSVPPTMVLITTTRFAASSARVVVNDELELGAVLSGLFAAASFASGPVVDPDYFGLPPRSPSRVRLVGSSWSARCELSPV